MVGRSLTRCGHLRKVAGVAQGANRGPSGGRSASDGVQSAGGKDCGETTPMTGMAIPEKPGLQAAGVRSRAMLPRWHKNAHRAESRGDDSHLRTGRKVAPESPRIEPSDQPANVSGPRERRASGVS
jgi:hypothetical protein